jgi:hypothetical protein
MVDNAFHPRSTISDPLFPHDKIGDHHAVVGVAGGDGVAADGEKVAGGI